MLILGIAGELCNSRDPAEGKGYHDIHGGTEADGKITSRLPGHNLGERIGLQDNPSLPNGEGQQCYYTDTLGNFDGLGTLNNSHADLQYGAEKHANHHSESGAFLAEGGPAEHHLKQKAHGDSRDVGVHGAPADELCCIQYRGQDGTLNTKGSAGKAHRGRTDLIAHVTNQCHNGIGNGVSDENDCESAQNAYCSDTAAGIPGRCVCICADPGSDHVYETVMTGFHRNRYFNRILFGNLNGFFVTCH